MIKFVENQLTAKQFSYLYNSTGWESFSIEQIEKSLKNDIYNISAWKNDELIGMGRLVGDSAIYWYIQNLIILPKFQLSGVGTAIMERLLLYIRNNSSLGSHIIVGLMCSEDTASFYRKFSFDIRPCKTLGPGATLEFDL